MARTIYVHAPMKRKYEEGEAMDLPIVFHDRDRRHPGRSGVVTIHEGYVAAVYPSREIEELIGKKKLVEISAEQYEEVVGPKRAALEEAGVRPDPGKAYYVGDLPEFADVDEDAIASLGTSKPIEKKLLEAGYDRVSDLVDAIVDEGVDLQNDRSANLTVRQWKSLEQTLVEKGLLEEAD